MKLCININTNTWFQLDGDVVISDDYLLDPASHQWFVEFGEMDSLLRDAILQVIDPSFVPASSVVTFIDEALVRKYIEQIKIFEDHFMVCFKAKLEIDIRR